MCILFIESFSRKINHNNNNYNDIDIDNDNDNDDDDEEEEEGEDTHKINHYNTDNDTAINQSMFVEGLTDSLKFLKELTGNGMHSIVIHFSFSRSVFIILILLSYLVSYRLVSLSLSLSLKQKQFSSKNETSGYRHI